MKKVILFLLIILSTCFAQYGSGYSTGPWRMWGMGFIGFIYLVLAFFLFSVIFWFCYLWIAKGKDKKEENKSNEKIS